MQCWPRLKSSNYELTEHRIQKKANGLQQDFLQIYALFLINLKIKILREELQPLRPLRPAGILAGL